MNLFLILRNASYGLIGTFLGIPLQAIAFIIIVRTLGPSNYGIYAFAFEFSFVFCLFADGGLNILTTREIAKKRQFANVYVANLLFLKGLISVFFFCIMIIIVHSINLDHEVRIAVYILGLANFLYTFLTFITAIFRAYQRMEFEGIVIFLQTLTFLILILTLVYGFRKGDNVFYVTICLFLSYCIPVLIGFLIIQHYLAKPAWQWRSDVMKYFFQEAVPIGIGVVLNDLFCRISTFVLKIYETSTDVGLFNAAFRLSFLLGVIPYMFSGAWLPILSQNAFSNPTVFHWNISQFFRVLFMIAVPLTITIALLSDSIISILYGNEYEKSIILLKLLMGYTFLIFLCTGNKTVLESYGQQKLWTFSLFIGLLVSIGLNLWLIPSVGLHGAVYAILGSTLVITFISSFFMITIAKWKPDYKIIGRIMLSGLIMGGVIYGLRPISWFVAAMGGGITYFLVLILLHEIDYLQIISFLRFFFKPMYSDSNRQ